VPAGNRGGADMADSTKPSLVDGKLISDKVTDKINPKIEKGAMLAVHALIVHQTGGDTAASAFASYSAGTNGAHFLIDKDGTIYQTAHVTQKCWHVGKIQSRCYKATACSADELKNIKAILFNQADSYSARVKKLHDHEVEKSYPDRYPTNDDSIGIELVSKFTEKTGYEKVTEAQNTSLAWVVSTLDSLLNLSASDTYRHPEVGYKQPTEAESARW
jgi:N-acetyl-anhydromuramyl-L-alanine amidase AmpD